MDANYRTRQWNRSHLAWGQQVERGERCQAGKSTKQIRPLRASFAPRLEAARGVRRLTSIKVPRTIIVSRVVRQPLYSSPAPCAATIRAMSGLSFGSYLRVSATTSQRASPVSLWLMRWQTCSIQLPVLFRAHLRGTPRRIMSLPGASLPACGSSCALLLQQSAARLLQRFGAMPVVRELVSPLLSRAVRDWISKSCSNRTGSSRMPWSREARYKSCFRAVALAIEQKAS